MHQESISPKRCLRALRTGVNPLHANLKLRRKQFCNVFCANQKTVLIGVLPVQITVGAAVLQVTYQRLGAGV